MTTQSKIVNRLFRILAWVFGIMLIAVSVIACNFAYNEQQSEIFSAINMSFSQMTQRYEDILSSVWKLYMPVFEDASSVSAPLQNYFLSDEPLSAIDKLHLTTALRQIRSRDERVEWVAVYSTQRETNYIIYNDANGIQALPDDFAFLDDLIFDSARMEVFPTKEIATAYGSVDTFAICGGVPINMREGRILFGYRAEDFSSAIPKQQELLPSFRMYILTDKKALYDSSGKYDDYFLPEGEISDTREWKDGNYFIHAEYCGNNSSLAVYLFSIKDYLLIAHRNTAWILSITLLFLFCSLAIQGILHRSVNREVGIIREGLDRIVGQQYDYRLPTEFQQGGLPEIAENINKVGSILDSNVKKAFYFEIKQKDAQLAQLQATFNPHFLYNTLEMLRSKAFSNGDDETAELITDLASVFRSFIGASTFVTLSEELAFSRKYLSLLNARYGDTVEIKFDFDSDLLQYGIIRNVFQLLIENYFVHGFKTEGSENLICLSGKSLNENDMLLQVIDNGTGLTDEELNAINKRIEEPIRHGEGSYGLKNLNQRLKLCYGDAYGLRLQRNHMNGLTVEMRIRKVTMEEFAKRRERITLGEKIVL